MHCFKNKISTMLFYIATIIIYEQEAVRTIKDSLLKPNTFSEYYLLGFPPDISEAIKALYKEPDFIEIYPGILFKYTKESIYLGLELCRGFIIVRAILSNTIILGFNIIKLDKLSKIYYLLNITFPKFYKDNSI
ncbi:unnamed protein product, partial [Clonostachys rhizophaga]